MAEWIGVTISAVGAVSTAAGVLAALWQYRRNSLESRRRDRRDKAVVAANEMEVFGRDPAVKNALAMLDWDPPVLQLAMADGTSRAVRVDADLFIAALRSNQAPVHEGWPWLPEEDRRRLAEAAGKGGGFTPEETAIRSAFDRFLDRLERIETLIERDVISAEDFETHFAYWLELMGEVPSASLNHFAPLKRAALWGYIDHYRFSNTRKLFARYKRAAPQPVG